MNDLPNAREHRSIAESQRIRLDWTRLGLPCQQTLSITQSSHPHAELSAVAATLQTYSYILEVTSSNTGPDTFYSRSCSSFSQALQANLGAVLRLDDSFLTNPFQFINRPTITRHEKIHNFLQADEQEYTPSGARIAHSSQQRATGWTAGDRFPGEATHILFSTASRAALGPTQPPMQWVPGAWSWPLTSIYRRGQEWWSYTSTLPYVLMTWCLFN
jgi:hypothetical protein